MCDHKTHDYFFIKLTNQYSIDNLGIRDKSL